MRPLLVFPYFVNLLLMVNGKKFPNDFIFGAATSAYQIEGAWNVDGKGENIWDNFTHSHPEKIVDHSTGDVACDSYNKLENDLHMLQWVGVTHYRFSISWARILPNGYADKINNDGIKYYNKLINGLIARNIEPIITLYHWDLPQVLSDEDGWLNESISDVFVDYARIVFHSFGDRVKLWITMNEPFQICQRSYGDGTLAPGMKSDGIGTYICGRNVLLAHAKAYKMYNKEFKRKQKGKIGFTADAFWYEPASNSFEDIAAAERAMQFHFGWFMNPIYSETGDYPQVLKDRVSANSIEENLPDSRLPAFSKQEINLIRGTYDFLGLNYYTTLMVSADTSNMTLETPSYMKDLNANFYINPEWEGNENSWIQDVPWGFRKVLNWVKKTYNNPLVIVTENGIDDKEKYRDINRQKYIQGHLQALLDAIHIDKCNVTGYVHWSIMDNMEWSNGYTYQFGLFYVDFKSLNKTRKKKQSAFYYKCIIENKSLQKC